MEMHNTMLKGAPPMVVDSHIYQPFLRDKAARIESEFGVNIRFHRDPRAVKQSDRPDAEILDAFDFDLSNAMTHYALTIYRGNRLVMTYGAAIYCLGDLDFVEYIEEVGLYTGDRGAVVFDRDSAAYALGRGITGRFAFIGNVWVPPDLRVDSGFDLRGLVKQLGEIVRSLNIGAQDCRHNINIVRDVHVRAGFRPYNDAMCPGILFKGVPAWLGYSRLAQFRRLALEQLTRESVLH